MKKDILKAIEIEKNYLEEKLKGNCPYQLIDKIIECGFDSLDEYFTSKKDYLIKTLNFDIVYITPADCISEIWRVFNEKLTEICIVETLSPTVYSCASKPCNKDFCIENGITVLDIPSGGGTIVSNINDTVIGISVPDVLQIDSAFILDGIASIIRKYIDNVEIIGNDILVNGGKVCGMTSLTNNGVLFTMMHFSFTDSSDLINAICCVDNKAAKKSPSYMTALDRNMLKEEVIKWLQST